MIYIIEDNSEDIIAVIEGPDNLNIPASLEEYKKVWYAGMEYSPTRYNELCKTEGYEVARSYLQTWRDEFEKRWSERGSPLDSFIKELSLKKHTWKYIQIEND